MAPPPSVSNNNKTMKSNRPIQKWLHRRSNTGTTRSSSSHSAQRNNRSKNIHSEWNEMNVTTNTTSTTTSDTVPITSECHPTTTTDTTVPTEQGKEEEEEPPTINVTLAWFRMVQECLLQHQITLHQCQAQNQHFINLLQEPFVSLTSSSSNDTTTPTFSSTDHTFKNTIDHHDHKEHHVDVINKHHCNNNNIINNNRDATCSYPEKYRNNSHSPSMHTPTTTAAANNNKNSAHRVSFDHSPAPYQIHMTQPAQQSPAELLPTNITDCDTILDNMTSDPPDRVEGTMTMSSTTAATTSHHNRTYPGMECTTNDVDDDLQSIHSTQTIDPTALGVPVSKSSAITLHDPMSQRRKRSFQSVTTSHHPNQTAATSTPTIITTTRHPTTKRRIATKTTACIRNEPDILQSNKENYYSNSIESSMPIVPSPILPLSSSVLSMERKNASVPILKHDGNNRNNDQQQQPLVYHDVVRNRTERQQLNCYDCPQCRKFYLALRNSGHDEEDCLILPRSSNSNSWTTTGCGHGTSSTNTDLDRSLPSRTTTRTISSHHGFGRHRARFAPTNTPNDFWELDFIDER